MNVEMYFHSILLFIIPLLQKLKAKTISFTRKEEKEGKISQPPPSQRVETEEPQVFTAKLEYRFPIPVRSLLMLRSNNTYASPRAIRV